MLNSVYLFKDKVLLWLLQWNHVLTRLHFGTRKEMLDLERFTALQTCSTWERSDFQFMGEWDRYVIYNCKIQNLNIAFGTFGGFLNKCKYCPWNFFLPTAKHEVDEKKPRSLTLCRWLNLLLYSSGTTCKLSFARAWRNIAILTCSVPHSNPFRCQTTSSPVNKGSCSRKHQGPYWLTF